MDKNFGFINRKGTDSIKWQLSGMMRMASYADEESLPLWVADMDFATAPCIIEALKKRIEHGIYGYPATLPSYYEALNRWYETHYGWKIFKEWVLSTPGIVPALTYMINAFTRKGDGVIIQEPVYYPFRNCVVLNGRRVVNSGLLEKEGAYYMDFADLETKASNPKTKMMILCSPHNPVARVWTKDELEQTASICQRHGVLLIADEIHSDLMLFGSKFHSCGLLPEALLKNTIICSAPSKTFNLAGLHISNLIIPCPQNFKTLQSFMERFCLNGEPNILGATALEAAYTPEGEAWMNQLIALLEDNYRFMKDFLAQHLPKIKMNAHQGTYLCWVDFRGTGLSPDEIDKKMETEAKIVTDMGRKFGKSGAGFMRFNLACHRSTLEEALRRLKKTFA